MDGIFHIFVKVASNSKSPLNKPRLEDSTLVVTNNNTDAQNNNAEVAADIENNNSTRNLVNFDEQESVCTSQNSKVGQTFLKNVADPNVFHVFERLKRDAGIQVTSGDLLSPGIMSIISNDMTLNTFTGIPTLVMLERITLIIENVISISRRDRLSVKERIVMTMMKMKQDLSFTMLAALFQTVSRKTCSRIFRIMIVVLAKVLSPALRWISREEVDDNLPLCFAQFPKTRIILDCTEFCIEKPKCLKCRLRCYSQYKSNFTLKYLVGVTSAGLISYVSPGYGGRASDKFIFMNSDILSKLTGNEDAIMVDKGFLIDAECLSYKIDLIRPPFLRDKKQFTYEEAILTKNIATARVHTYRAC